MNNFFYDLPCILRNKRHASINHLNHYARFFSLPSPNTLTYKLYKNITFVSTVKSVQIIDWDLNKLITDQIIKTDIKPQKVVMIRAAVNKSFRGKSGASRVSKINFKSG